MSVQDVIDAINEGSTIDKIKDLVEKFRIDLDEPVGELRLRVLHHAVFKDRVDCVKLSLQKGCDINARDQCGFTPLHIAARYNRPDLANELISMGAHVDSTDSLGCAPLHMALQRGHASCAEVLLQHGAEPNSFYKDIGYEIHALPGIYPNCLELLLSYGADPNLQDTQGLFPIHHATRANNTLYVYILLKNGADPNALPRVENSHLDKQTALKMAVFIDAKAIIELLLLYGADPNIKDELLNAPLHYAAGRGNIEVAHLLIQSGAILTARNSLRCHPLHRACTSGADPALIKLLLDSGAFVNSTTTLMDTPVKCILSYWKKLSEEQNENPNRGADDSTPNLWREMDERCLQQILTLLDYGARITLSARVLDPFSVLLSWSMVANMANTKALILKASVDTRLITEQGNIPEVYQRPLFDEIAFAANNPMSLRKACRIVVRSSLGKRNLPGAVKELQLPASLHSYLTFR